MKYTLSNKICPKCNNKLRYWVSDDYYNKGTKFFDCEVCKWEPKDLENKKESCKNGCDGIKSTCNECPNVN